MKRISLNSYVILSVLLCFALIQRLQGQIIVIDAGHGYNSDGSNGDGRTTTEITTNWAVSIKLQELIQNNNSWTVHLTRPANGNGSQVTINDRWAMANDWNADMFLSIHCNAGGGTGTETFYCNNNDPTPTPDISFAAEVQAKMVQYGSWTNRRVVEDNSYLGYHLGVLNYSTATSCLNEIGFVDKTSDATKLLDNIWRDKFANAYFVALQNQINNSSNPPSAPVILSPGTINEPGESISTTTPTLKWNTVSNATSYKLYISKYPYGEINIIYSDETIVGSSNTITVPSNKLFNGIKYRWNMRAVNSSGESSPSNTLYFTPNLVSEQPDLKITAGTQNITPTAVIAGSNVTASCSEDNIGNASASANCVTLWISTDGILNESNDTYIGKIAFPSVSALSCSAVLSSTVRIPENTSSGNYYLFFWADGDRVVNEIDDGNNFASVQLTITQLLTPTAPSNLVSLANGSIVNLSWIDNSTNESGFRIERKIGAGGTYTEIETVSENVSSYTNSGLSTNQVYYYRLRAYNSSSISDYSNEYYATTMTASSGLSLSVVSNTQIKLTWTDNALGETGFKIERKTGINGIWSETADIPANSSSYTNTGLIENTTYYYRVRAYANSTTLIPHYSNYSNEANATITNIEQFSRIIPDHYNLNNNFPNPFNPSTTISYDLPKEGMVTIKIYDLLGREVAILVNEYKNAGSYSAEFNAGNLSSGTYIYRMVTEDFTEIKKLILMK